jgi:hypothetical protein
VTFLFCCKPLTGYRAIGFGTFCFWVYRFIFFGISADW